MWGRRKSEKGKIGQSLVPAKARKERRRSLGGKKRQAWREKGLVRRKRVFPPSAESLAICAGKPSGEGGEDLGWGGKKIKTTKTGDKEKKK